MTSRPLQGMLQALRGGRKVTEQPARRQQIAVQVARVTLEPDGTISFVMRPGACLDAANTRELLQAFTQLAGNLPRRILVHSRGLRSQDRRSREMCSAPELARLVDRVAVIALNPVARVLTAFFVRVSKPRYPMRLFETEQAARAWLHGQGQT